MNRKLALARARRALAAGHIEEAALESELLLRHVLDIDRVRLYLDLDMELDLQQEEAFSRAIQRRLKGEPSAYITGHREFYGIDFHVDSRVLIPRPESELLVEASLAVAGSGSVETIADIGTGCGNIAISLAVSLPGVEVYATDISPGALEVAGLNCRRHGLAERIKLLQGDMLEPLPGPVDLMVANLPYVKRGELPEGEPGLALDGGENGLASIYRLCRQAGEKLNPGGALLLEIGEGQAEPAAGMLESTLAPGDIETFRDSGGIQRVLRARLTHRNPDDRIRGILSQPIHRRGGRTA